jgi:hypothetical protein
VKLPLLTRLFRIPVAVGASVAAIALTYPGGVTAALEDFRDFRQHSGDLEREQDRDIQMNDRSMCLTERISAKEAVTFDLIAGRTTLDSAAERFLALTASDAVSMDFLRSRFDGSTDLERVARNVIDYAITHVPVKDAPAVVARLDAQFQARFGHPR